MNFKYGKRALDLLFSVDYLVVITFEVDDGIDVLRKTLIFEYINPNADSEIESVTNSTSNVTNITIEVEEVLNNNV